MAVDPAFDMRLVAASTRDLFEDLARLMAEGALDTRFSRPESRMADEVEVYNALLPGLGELTATMFIEIGDAGQIKPVLDALQVIDTGDHVRLQIGSHVVVGEFEAGHSDEERGKLAAVHFVRFALPDVARRAFAGAEVGLTVDHPGDRGRTVLTPAARRLAEDLA
jgi:hypothetical protein